MGKRESDVEALSKTQRQQRIALILKRQSVNNQAQLVEILEADGISATQATVSRDLKELGVIKVRTGNGDSIYNIPRLPRDQIMPEEQLHKSLVNWVVGVFPSHNLVVLSTLPASAHVVASAIDHTLVPNVVGTISGDDTVFVAVAENSDAKSVAAWFTALMQA